ncbi:MAG TPA: hypothetical protein VK400_13815 [Pyrinomonadaceae bacterium]|nr:hypothetical protein [Pyrinomonadaceae bacterium]
MSNKTLPFFKFDDFYLDIDERCLTFQDKPVSMTPKAFQTLVVLLRESARASRANEKKDARSHRIY